MGAGITDAMHIPIGVNYDTQQPFSIDSTKHTNVEGMSGMGKSTLLARLFVEHVRNGGGGCFIDPHGDVADELASLMPRSRMWDFIWFDPLAERVPPFNPLHYRDPSELELGKESLFSVVKSLAGAAWGDESARVSMGAIDAVCECFDRPTPVHIFRFLADDKFRSKVLAKSDNPLLRMFKEQYDQKLRDSEQMSKLSPAINKFGKFLRPSIMPVIGQPDSLDFLDVMNEKKILVCRLSKGKLGDEISQILGSIIISMISIAALQREKQSKREDFMLIVDETHNYHHGGRFGSLLAEARKYGISVITALQGGYQVPFIKDLFSNCPTKIAFNVSGLDAQAIADDWRWEDFPQKLSPEYITKLPKYQMYVRSFVANTPDVSRVVSYPKVRKRGDEADRETLISHSLMRWGKDRKKAEQGIIKVLNQPN
jgi:hypothetical protein